MSEICLGQDHKETFLTCRTCQYVGDSEKLNSFLLFIKEEFTHDDAVVSKRGVDGRQLPR